MQKITLEYVVNSAPKDLLLVTLENYFDIAKEKKTLIPGFRNTGLRKAKEGQLKSAVIDYLKAKVLGATLNDGVEFTLEKLEEQYNEKKWACFGTLLAGFASNINNEICTEAYLKFFAPKSIDEEKDAVAGTAGSMAMELSNIQKEVAEMGQKLNEAYEKYRKELSKQNEKHQKELAKKNESIESLKKAKKDKEKEVDELKEEKEKLVSDNATLATTIQARDEEIQKLKIDNERILSELAEMRAKLDKDKPRIVIYGYPKAFYGYDAREDVIQPESFQDLLNVGGKYKVTELYYRPCSISRMSNVAIIQAYPGIVIAAKNLLELEAMGYLNRNRKGDK